MHFEVEVRQIIYSTLEADQIHTNARAERYRGFLIRKPAFLVGGDHRLRFFPFVVSMASSTVNRWLRPEVYPLFAAVGLAVGICGMQLARNILINPEVRVNKENRAAGILENFSEGEKYAEHGLRKFVRNRAPEIMPSINSFFADPK
ncbi:NADH-ubiquinone reductase complex 1 MLRQ subunit-like protein [Cinnamomum micranthum f. kanehirae]|uniref:NADH-ubiquinone reductase complex 1 MLRQ subunit-like protein n=1 Tax=Cinnamomum micranthum f. kanehirae TaxID=337451 RepID=A0A443NGC9_9MAGN|nr:NADH-ubiquinone reductase complex 1 MLRQ subunit-like protein [Cinnamomum micranthum f. kanehirae]